MRIKQCCCGCSLRTGTQILLYLDLIYQVWTFISLIVKACMCDSGKIISASEFVEIAWASIMFVLVLYGMTGVEKHWPSFLLPYICANILVFIGLLYATISYCLASEEEREQIFARASERFCAVNPNQIDQASTVAMTLMIPLAIIWIVLFFYFIVVTYSYYKQMQEEDQVIRNTPSGTGYVTYVYAAPAMQVQGNVYPSVYDRQSTTTAYPQQSAASPYLAKNIS